MRGAERGGLSFFEYFLVCGLLYFHTVSPAFTVGTHTRGVQYYGSQEVPDRIERHPHNGPWTDECLNVLLKRLNVKVRVVRSRNFPRTWTWV